MKQLVALVLLAVSQPILAGYYGQTRVNTYDPVTGLYYRAVEQENEERGFLSKGPAVVVRNINIFDPRTEESRLLFEDPQTGIIVMVFETGIKNGSVEFNGASSNFVLNNGMVLERPPRDKLLIGVRNLASNNTTLFISDKKGRNLKSLAVVPVGADWHIDVKNSKLRIVHQTGSGLKIESFDW